MSLSTAIWNKIIVWGLQYRVYSHGLLTNSQARIDLYRVYCGSGFVGKNLHWFITTRFFELTKEDTWKSRVNRARGRVSTLAGCSLFIPHLRKSIDFDSPSIRIKPEYEGCSLLTLASTFINFRPKNCLTAPHTSNRTEGRIFESCFEFLCCLNNTRFSSRQPALEFLRIPFSASDALNESALFAGRRRLWVR